MTGPRQDGLLLFEYGRFLTGSAIAVLSNASEDTVSIVEEFVSRIEEP